MMMSRCFGNFLRFGEFEFATRFRVDPDSICLEQASGIVDMDIEILQNELAISNAKVQVRNLGQCLAMVSAAHAATVSC